MFIKGLALRTHWRNVAVVCKSGVSGLLHPPLSALLCSILLISLFFSDMESWEATTPYNLLIFGNWLENMMKPF